ncbi:hypothetical protein NHF46_01300 [Arthrobacter alpinus]|nr:hypothetical protein [Arthrobacter alpinus]
MAAGQTIASTPAHPEGLAANVELSAINAALIPYHRAQIHQFVEAVINDQRPAVTGNDATNALRILLAIYSSARTGTPVRFAEFPSGVPTATDEVVARLGQTIAVS